MLRIFVLGQAAALILLSAGVLWEYGKAFVRGASLLPLHVALIALSYLLLALVAAIDFSDQVSEGQLSISSLLTEFGYAIGLVSLFIILVYERRKASGR